MPIFCASLSLQTISCILQNTEIFLKTLQIIPLTIIWIINIYSIISYKKYGDDNSFSNIKITIFKSYSMNKFKLLLDKSKDKKLHNENFKGIKKDTHGSTQNQINGTPQQFKRDSVGLEYTKNNYNLRKIRVTKRNYHYSMNFLIHQFNYFINFNV